MYAERKKNKNETRIGPENQLTSSFSGSSASNRCITLPPSVFMSVFLSYCLFLFQNHTRKTNLFLLAWGHSYWGAVKGYRLGGNKNIIWRFQLNEWWKCMIEWHDLTQGATELSNNDSVSWGYLELSVLGQTGVVSFSDTIPVHMVRKRWKG